MIKTIKRIGEKNNLIYVLFIAVIFIFFSSSLLFNNKIFITHDSEPQIVRIGAFYKSLMDGQIPPRWAGDLNFGFGDPALIFFFPLQGYLGSFFHIIGFSLQDSYKAIMILSFVLAPVFFYLWLRFKFDRPTCFVAALFYGLSPYHFLDIFVRGQLGEMLAFVFIPLVFLSIERIKKNQNIGNVFIGALFYFLLILSHNILSLIFSFIFAFYIILLNFGKIKIILINSFFLLLGLFLSAFFWLPALFEAKFINSKLFVAGMYNDHFIKLSNLIHSEWGYGSYINSQGGLAPQIGIFHFLFFVFSFFAFIKFKTERKKILFWFFIALLSIFMTTSFSSFIWNKSHIIQQFQFPWRLMALASFAIAVLIPYGLLAINKKFYPVIILTVIVLSFPYSKANGWTHKSDKFYFNYPGTAAYHGEATTIWVAGDESNFAKNQVEIVSGEGEVRDVVKKSNKHIFQINAKTDVEILDNTVYFPGWSVISNGKKIPIEFQNSNHRGFVTFRLPEGSHKVNVLFKESPVRFISNVISLLALAFVIILVIFNNKIKKLINTK